VKVLGFSIAHDSSVCVYENGKIVLFLKEERFSKNKRDKIPFISLQKALYEHNDVDAVVLCAVQEEKEIFDIYSRFIKKYIKNENCLFFNLTGSHHLQHASLAFYNSGFKNAAVIIVDRNGSKILDSARESETIFFAQYPNKIEEYYKNFWVYDDTGHEKIKKIYKDTGIETDARSMHGIVKVYESATTMIGEHALENGKTMGLSAYGNKKRKFPDFFVNKTNIVNNFYFAHKDISSEYQSVYIDFENIESRYFSEKTHANYSDLAWQVQKQTQEAVAFLVEKTIHKYHTKNIVLSGGYALNVVANQYLINKFPDLNFYFEPIADDSGNSIGGAMLVYRSLTQDENIYPIKDTFFHGYKYDLPKIDGSLALYSDVAKLLYSNKSVGVYDGFAEAGPRALGHRSILFNAMNPDAKNIVNKIKNREWYRPFAAMVLEEDAHKYFDMKKIKKSEYMTISFDVLPEAINLIPGVVHVDGSCRIQTVSESNKEMFELLKEFKKISGHGILLNTSLNLAGDPLAETPEDALNILEKSSLDFVWFPEISKIVEKS
jgi:carbamoyltransferase